MAENLYFTEAFAHESVTVDATAGGVSLTAATYAPGGRPGAVKAVITCETAQVRYTYDGTAPTTTVGHLLESGSAIIVEGPGNISKFKAIRTGGTSGTLKVTYES